MIYTLLATQKLYKDKLEKYHIEVDAERGIIKSDHSVLKLPQNATTAMCKRELNKLINAAQQRVKDREFINQESLFN